MTTYLARAAGLRDVRELSRGLTPMQYKKASKADCRHPGAASGTLPYPVKRRDEAGGMQLVAPVHAPCCGSGKQLRGSQYWLRT